MVRWDTSNSFTPPRIHRINNLQTRLLWCRRTRLGVLLALRYLLFPPLPHLYCNALPATWRPAGGTDGLCIARHDLRFVLYFSAAVWDGRGGRHCRAAERRRRAGVCLRWDAACRPLYTATAPLPRTFTARTRPAPCRALHTPLPRGSLAILLLRLSPVPICGTLVSFWRDPILPFVSFDGFSVIYSCRSLLVHSLAWTRWALRTLCLTFRSCWGGAVLCSW